jgi:CubicO group peptidase (beta-lactamase class C family)
VPMISPKTAILFGFFYTSVFADSSPNISAYIDHIFAKWSDSTPGCAVGVAKAGHLEFSKAYGSADLENGIRNSPDTVFEAGSVSKQFTCVFRLMVDRISRSTWTLIPAQRGQNSGVIVDSFRGEPQ